MTMVIVFTLSTSNDFDQAFGVYMWLLTDCRVPDHKHVDQLTPV